MNLSIVNSECARSKSSRMLHAFFPGGFRNFPGTANAFRVLESTPTALMKIRRTDPCAQSDFDKRLSSPSPLDESHKSHSSPQPGSVAGLPVLMKQYEQLITEKPLNGNAANGHAPVSELGKRYLTHLTVRKPDKIVVLRINEVEAIESAGNCVLVQAGKDSLLVRQTLEGLLGQLEPGKFMRVSRSAIVNLQQIRELLPNYLGEKVAILQSGKHLTVTRNLRDVEEALKFS